MDGPDLDRVTRLTERFGRQARSRDADLDVVAEAFAKRSLGLQQRRSQGGARPSDPEARAEALEKAFSGAARRAAR
jgi:phosphopantetheine adenylyltransferase